MHIWQLKSYAKINTHLGVQQRLMPSGKHRVDSIMFALDIADTLAISLADAKEDVCDSKGEPYLFAIDPQVDVHMRFVASTEALPDLFSNTVYLAARKMLDASKSTKKVAIELTKQTPSGMGLGASSGNAAAVLQKLAEVLLDKDAYTQADLYQAAREIGADVPFFLDTAPAYFVGAGDVLEERFVVDKQLDVVVLCPTKPNVTRGMYQAFDREPVYAADLLPQLEYLRAGQLSASGLAPYLHNNFEGLALAQNISAKEALFWLREQEEVLAAQVSGSGAASFGLCNSFEDAKKVALAAKNMNLLAFATRTLI